MWAGGPSTVIVSLSHVRYVVSIQLVSVYEELQAAAKNMGLDGFNRKQLEEIIRTMDRASTYKEVLKVALTEQAYHKPTGSIECLGLRVLSVMRSTCHRLRLKG